MGCIGTNWKKRKDIEYITFMATIFGKNTGKTIGIYERIRAGIGKYYDFEIAVDGREYFAKIQFDREFAGKDILQDNGNKESDVVGDSPDSDIRGGLGADSGGVFSQEQPIEVRSGSTKSKKNTKHKE
jgi:hypothetical protein